MADSSNVAVGYIKDAAIILTFLASVAGVYVQVNAQLVRLDQKVAVLEDRIKEIKLVNEKLTDKISSFQATANSMPRP